ncbi:site-specific integrase [Methylosinus sp. PW1]|uniref:tyrosine-type recombinase/integrase n=1 Tax=Methylosinus sp. PW1 TaxID=107636 RepID=UPI00055A9ABC|nr:site-specific integrase [Methylosinus sp. PW1]
MPKLTKSVVDKIEPDPEGRDRFVWDSELKGFGVRMKPSGSASFIVQYRTAQGQTRRVAFAKVGTLTPDEARKEAIKKLVEAQSGRDPSAERHDARNALLVSTLCALYLEAARAGLVLTRFHRPKRQSTVAIDEGRVSRHIVPLLGSRVARELTRADIQRMADAIAAGKTAGIFKAGPRGKAVVEGGPGTAARVVELFGGIWTWAERRGLISGQNPAHGVEKHRGEAKDRVLNPAELAALGATLRARAASQPMACAALRLLALTGMRREEACGLRWIEFDAAGSCLRLEATKTGRSMRPIGKAAADLITALPHDDGAVFLFPNASGAKPADLKKQIAALFDAAGLSDARSHDLRRTFASVAADEGYGDSTIAELLGHSQRGVTARHYIRRPDAALLAAADKVAERIARAMDDNTAQVVKLPDATDRRQPVP